MHNNGYVFDGVEWNASITMDAGWSLDGNVCNVQFDSYRDVVSSSPDNRFPDKLDYFTVYDANGLAGKNVHFNYNNDVTKRLQLQSVELRGNDDNAATAQVYGFNYNLISLPDYLNFNTDVYGYYNGPTSNVYITSDAADYYQDHFTDATWRQNYLNTRVPNITYAQAEILNKVTYPTGGHTTYEYEANDYGTVYQNWPPTLTPNTGGTLSTGGVRIKSITNDDLTGHTTSKTYYYVNSGTQASSGVLNYIPVFYETNPDYPFSTNIAPPANQQKLIDNLSPTDANYGYLVNRFSGKVIYVNFGTDPINPMSYNKVSHITYSEVKEVNDDGSFVIHTYKNYDNGFADHGVFQQPHPLNDPNGDVRAVYDHQAISNLWKEDDMSSMELERGQVLSELLYDNTSALKRQTTYSYNDDPARFQDIQDVGTNIRLLKCIPSPMCNSQYAPSLRYVATMVYTYYPYLKQTVVTENENGSQLVTTSNYTYDGTYRLMTQQETTSSKNETLTSITRYPNAMVTPGTPTIYDAMVANRLLSFTVQKEQQVNHSSMHTQITGYSQTFPSNTTLILPQNGQTQYKGETPETRMNYLDYDDAGNPLAVMQQGGTTTCFVWSYNKTYPVAKIENAQYSDVQTALGGATAVNNFALTIPGADKTVRDFLVPLRTSLLLSNAMVTTYTYHTLFGVTSQTSPDNKTVYYDYDNMGRLSVVRDNDKNILKKICYNYAGQAGPCAQTYNNVAISQQFSKQGCTSGVSTSVTYLVAAGTYQSTISQADADQQAFNKIASDGQAYGNANAVCLCESCSGANATEGVQCINGQCETGVKVYTSRFHSTIIPNSPYFCVYHYEFSDGSWSENYSVQSPNPC